MEMGMRNRDRWTGPIVVGGKTFHMTQLPDEIDGGQVWSVSVALASELTKVKVEGSVVDLGCGCGLIGASLSSLEVTMVDAKEDNCLLAKQNLKVNGATKSHKVLQSHWEDIDEPFDNVLAQR